MKPERQIDWLIIAALIASAILLWSAPGYHPYVYFQLLRWVVCTTAGFAAWRFAQCRWYLGTVLLILIAILFNPLSPIHMRRWEWPTYDRLGAVVALVASALLYVVSRRLRTNEKAASLGE